MISSGATFSSCKKYRYRLWRVWDSSKPKAIFILLNPSTADEYTNDPTVQRCQVRAQRLGFGGLEILNIFAYRSTDPAALYQVADPVGPLNDDSIRACIEENITRSALPMVICGWGKNGQLSGRAMKVFQIINSTGTRVFALKVNESDGSPAHPLYLSYGLQPRPIVELADELARNKRSVEGNVSSAAPDANDTRKVCNSPRGLFHARTAPH